MLSGPHQPHIHFIFLSHCSSPFYNNDLWAFPNTGSIRGLLCFRSIISKLWEPHTVSLWSLGTGHFVKSGFGFPRIIFIFAAILMYIVPKIAFGNSYKLSTLETAQYVVCLSNILPMWPRFPGYSMYRNVPGFTGALGIVVSRKSSLATWRMFIIIETDLHILLRYCLFIKITSII